MDTGSREETRHTGVEPSERCGAVELRQYFSAERGADITASGIGLWHSNLLIDRTSL
jgi:hypothetical protein